MPGLFGFYSSLVGALGTVLTDSKSQAPFLKNIFQPVVEYYTIQLDKHRIKISNLCMENPTISTAVADVSGRREGGGLAKF